MAFALAVPLAGIAAQDAAARADRPDASAPCRTVPTQSSRVTKDSSLTGVAATNWCNVWAVGWNFTGPLTRTLIEHWNGKNWKQVPSPSPYRPHGDNELAGVAATSSRNAWAVGSGEARPASAPRTLIEHWDGTAWRRTPSPTPGGRARLSAVAADTSADDWAAGWHASTSSDMTLIEHWNGKSWAHVPSPNPSAAGSYLTGIAATSADNAWAVGYSFAPAASPRPRVRTLIERWNGASWSLVPSPSPAGRGDNRLLAVSALSSSNAWAVGYSREPGARARPLIEHWDGTAWTRVPGAGPGQKHVTLLGVSAVSARSAWAVGTYSSGGKPFDVGTGNRTLILRWNGTGWHRVGSPNQASKLGSNELTAVAAVSGTNAWSIGNHAGLGAETEPVAEHWRHGAWHLVATPMLR
jgi:hypothetical protein